MKNILIVTMIAIALTGCFEKSRKAQLVKTLFENRVNSSTVNDPDPASGTLLSWGCDDYTRLNEIADGLGGSTIEEIERSPDCGWNPPDAGTVSETRCEDPYTLVTVFNDGEYGFYEEEEEKSEECGYVPPAVTPVKEQGDRFDPVVFAVDTSLEGEEIEFSVTLGTAEQRGDELLIKGDGRIGEGVLVVDDEEWQYTINEEPRCGEDDSGVYDCMGYFHTGRPDGYIYYGEDDARIVEWEIALVWYTNEDAVTATSGSTSFDHEGWVEKYEEGDSGWNKAQKLIGKYNEAYERSGVHVRFVLADAGVGHFHGVGNLSSFRVHTSADIILGFGVTCDNACGCASVVKYFREGGSAIPSGTSVCGWDTDIHEIGHTVGLAHGPQNGVNEASGYIWPEFGHGWEALCSVYADIMSYDYPTYAHHNSTLTCGEMYSDLGRVDPESEFPGGSRSYADAAYHLNRIRYDVSLVSCDDICRKVESDQAEVPEEGILITDKIDSFTNGRERRQRFLNQNPQFLPDRMGPKHQH